MGAVIARVGPVVCTAGYGKGEGMSLRFLKPAVAAWAFLVWGVVGFLVHAPLLAVRGVLDVSLFFWLVGIILFFQDVRYAMKGGNGDGIE